jgi:hypothetical protein
MSEPSRRILELTITSVRLFSMPVADHDRAS